MPIANVFLLPSLIVGLSLALGAVLALVPRPEHGAPTAPQRREVPALWLE